jgi:hypothetical protein
VNIAWRQGTFKQGTAQRLNVFSPVSLLSLLRCAHARCRARWFIVILQNGKARRLGILKNSVRSFHAEGLVFAFSVQANFVAPFHADRFSPRHVDIKCINGSYSLSKAPEAEINFQLVFPFAIYLFAYFLIA